MFCSNIRRYKFDKRTKKEKFIDGHLHIEGIYNEKDKRKEDINDGNY